VANTLWPSKKYKKISRIESIIRLSTIDEDPGLAEKKLMGYITGSSLDLCVVKQQIKMGKSPVSTELKSCILKLQQKI